MKTLATLFSGAALALAASAPAYAETRAEKSEARLAKMLEGRTAGEPVSCINTLRSSSDLQVLDYVGVVYDAGDTIYVARAADPKSLGRDDVVVIERFGSQLCKQDVVRTVDRYAGFTTGVVFLGDFVPYTRAGG